MMKQFSDGSKGFTSVKDPDRFDSILSEFNNFVHAKLYKKFNYDTYKKLQRNTGDVRIIGHEKSDFLEVIVNGTTYPFKINDNSFGEYLFFHILTDEESNIILNTYTYNKNSYKYDDYSLATFESNINDIVKELDAKGYYYDALGGNPATIADIASYSVPLESAKTLTIGGDNVSAIDYIYPLSNKAVSAIDDDIDILFNKTAKIDDLETVINTLTEKVNSVFDDNNKKENKNMKFVNFEFGPVTTDKVRMSIYGMAVKNADGVYAAYDSKSKEIVNVDILNFDGSKFLYKMPVAIKDVAVGDVIIHMRKPMIVLAIGNDAFTVVDVYEGEAKNILPTKSPFGFNFMTKIVSLMDMCGGISTANVDAPFGNMLPFLMMNEDTDIDPMMLMLMMGGKMDMSNPMMMYFLMKDGGGKMDDLLPLMLMMGNTNATSASAVN